LYNFANMELRYRFANDDALNAFRVRSKQPWTMFLRVLPLVLMFLVGIFLVNHDLASIGWRWLVLSTALGIALYEGPRFQIRRAMKANPCLQGEIVLLLNNEATEFSHATGKSKLQWRAPKQNIKRPRICSCSCVSSSGSTAIPKRVMSSQQLEDLGSLLKAQIPQKITNPMD
jgi:hypothetical protein